MYVVHTIVFSYKIKISSVSGLTKITSVVKKPGKETTNNIHVFIMKILTCVIITITIITIFVFFYALLDVFARLI